MSLKTLAQAASLIILFAISGTGLCRAQTSQAGYPEHTNDYVNDFAGILAPPARRALEARFKRLEYQTGIEAVVVTINSRSEYATADLNLETFATHLFNDWGIGHRKSNDGVLFLVAAKDRQVRIELGGAYARRYDARMKGVLESVVLPRFKAGDMTEGILLGAAAIEKEITIPVTWYEFYKWHLLVAGMAVAMVLSGIFFEARGRRGLVWLCFGGFFLLLFGLLAMLIAGKSESGFGGGSSGGGGASGSW